MKGIPTRFNRMTRFIIKAVLKCFLRKIYTFGHFGSYLSRIGLEVWSKSSKSGFNIDGEWSLLPLDPFPLAAADT